MEEKYKFIKVDSNFSEARLDRVIRKNFPTLNQVKIEKALRNKMIMLNSQKAQANSRVKIDDEIKILASIVNNAPEFQKFKPKMNPDDVSLITDNIIFHDADLIIINKPAGLAVQGGSKIKRSVDDLMPVMLDSLEVYEKPVHKLVHRLDKETSGILLIALNDKTAKELALAFKERRVNKKYLSIIDGYLSVNNGIITSIIDNKERHIQEDNAITHYKVLKKKGNASLVEFKPITGKKHQLRLHALEMGFPIIGDEKYNLNFKDSKFKNLMLHAFEITFPYKGSILKISAELPEHFKQAIAKLFGSSYNVRN